MLPFFCDWAETSAWSIVWSTRAIHLAISDRSRFGALMSWMRLRGRARLSPGPPGCRLRHLGDVVVARDLQRRNPWPRDRLRPVRASARSRPWSFAAAPHAATSSTTVAPAVARWRPPARSGRSAPGPSDGATGVGAGLPARGASSRRPWWVWPSSSSRSTAGFGHPAVRLLRQRVPGPGHGRGADPRVAAAPGWGTVAVAAGSVALRPVGACGGRVGRGRQPGCR